MQNPRKFKKIKVKSYKKISMYFRRRIAIRKIQKFNALACFNN